jgi:hypothetical protein
MPNLKPLSGHPTIPVFQPALASFEILTSRRALLQISLESVRACLIGQRGIQWRISRKSIRPDSKSDNTTFRFLFARSITA